MSVVKAYGRVCAIVCASCDGRPTFADCSRRYQCCRSLKQPVNVRTPEQCSRHIIARTDGKDPERGKSFASGELSFVSYEVRTYEQRLSCPSAHQEALSEVPSAFFCYSELS